MYRKGAKQGTMVSCTIGRPAIVASRAGYEKKKNYSKTY